MVHYDPREFTPLKGGMQVAVQRVFVAPYLLLANRLEITGREKVPRTGPLIVAANHLSMLDPPLLAVVCNRPVAYMAKEELFENPLLSRFLQFLGGFSVNRAHPDIATFKAARDVLRRGWALVMFIEGTRNKVPGQLLRPALGPAYVARMNQAPILPVGIVGTNQRFGKAYAHVGDPIMPSDDLEATTWIVMETLSRLTGFDLPPDRQLADPSQWEKTG
jgi:1-acyl-sn-glycerol-3-phosphate acyltransferase